MKYFFQLLSLFLVMLCPKVGTAVNLSGVVDVFNCRFEVQHESWKTHQEAKLYLDRIWDSEGNQLSGNNGYYSSSRGDVYFGDDLNQGYFGHITLNARFYNGPMGYKQRIWYEYNIMSSRSQTQAFTPKKVYDLSYWKDIPTGSQLLATDSNLHEEVHNDISGGGVHLKTNLDFQCEYEKTVGP